MLSSSNPTLAIEIEERLVAGLFRSLLTVRNTVAISIPRIFTRGIGQELREHKVMEGEKQNESGDAEDQALSKEKRNRKKDRSSKAKIPDKARPIGWEKVINQHQNGSKTEKDIEDMEVVQKLNRFVHESVDRFGERKRNLSV